jgi:hypothetical protein
MTWREDMEMDKVMNEGSKKTGMEDMEKDKVMNKGSKKTGKANDRDEEEKEGRWHGGKIWRWIRWWMKGTRRQEGQVTGVKKRRREDDREGRYQKGRRSD